MLHYVYYSHVTIGSADTTGLAGNDESVGTDTIASSNLESNFNLELEVGRITDGEFISFTNGDTVDVGRTIRVQLQHSQTYYLSVLIELINKK